MNDKFSDEALQKAWQNFQKKHKDVSGRINEDLKKKSVDSAFLQFYGRNVKSEYELFQSIRNDEIIHRNRSIREIAMRSGE